MASKAVKELNKFPHSFGFYDLGNKLDRAFNFLRNLHDDLSTSGGLFSLVNELRTKLHTGGDVFALANELRTKCHTGGDIFALANELRTRLHTAGDYQVLISAIRGEIIGGGRLADILVDLCDKAYNQCLVNPGWQQNTGAGGNTQIENTAAIDAIVDGVYLAAVYAATQDVAVDAGANTGVGEFKAITLSVNAAGALAQTVSAAAGSAPVTPPRPPSGQCPVGVIQIPASFTPGATAVQTAWFTQGFPRRLAVYAPIVTPNVAAIAATNVGAVTATAVGAVSASALSTKASDLKPDAFEDKLP